MSKEDAKEWKSMETAPTDGTIVELQSDTAHGLPSFVTTKAYDSIGGWCIDELRNAIAWREI